MDEVAISVIVPVYNVEKYLDDCLNSIERQSMHNIEILCVDDASSDMSPKIIQAHCAKDMRVVHIRQKRHQGQSIARNIGLHSAKGEYIYFVDSDDVVKDGALEKLYHIMCQDLELDGILFAAEIAYTNGKNTKKFFSKDKTCGVTGAGAYVFSQLLSTGEYSSGVWCQFWRKRFLQEKKLLFDDRLFLQEDVLFTFQAIMLAKKIHCIKDVFYIYHRREKTVSTNRINECAFKKLIYGHLKLVKFWLKEGRNQDHLVVQAVGNFLAKRRNYLWNQLLELCKHGLDFENIKFDSKECELFFYTFILGKYESISDFFSRALWFRIRNANHIVVYGNGVIGKQVMEQLRSYGINKFFVAVTQKGKNIEDPYNVYEIKELQNYKEDCMVLISVANSSMQREMINTLKMHDFRNYACIV